MKHTTIRTSRRGRSIWILCALVLIGVFAGIYSIGVRYDEALARLPEPKRTAVEEYVNKLTKVEPTDFVTVDGEIYSVTHTDGYNVHGEARYDSTVKDKRICLSANKHLALDFATKHTVSILSHNDDGHLAMATWFYIQ